MARIRTGSASLAIETGRWEGKEQHERICQLCKVEVEDEEHFLLHCPALQEKRTKAWQQLADTPPQNRLQLAMAGGKRDEEIIWAIDTAATLTRERNKKLR